MLLNRTQVIIFVLLGIAPSAGAQELCPELARLSAEAEAISSKVADLPGPDRCYPYVHYSVAWADLERYVHKHQESCGVSPALLADIKRRHQVAVAQRVEACGGLRQMQAPKENRNRFPPEIRPRS
ncbi:hypothetical protein [Bradyrhizobium sp. SRS-191]|uniref:hypothetical protein n=1 Tax=Bradyrhizobium sp. SRS-191 TaxID=2962606 RepID=UPI00211F2A57|nr:hypothetical protein [Bradyrhizobium sp. SRS-191]